MEYPRVYCVKLIVTISASGILSLWPLITVCDIRPNRPQGDCWKSSGLLDLRYDGPTRYSWKILSGRDSVNGLMWKSSFSYNVVKLIWWNSVNNWTLQNTPHITPSWTSARVSDVRSLRKINLVIVGSHYIVWSLVMVSDGMISYLML